MPEVISLVPHALLVSLTSPLHISSSFFFFNDTATTEIYTLSLHDALPISGRLFRQEPERGTYHHREGGERGAGARGGTQGARAGPQAERPRGGIAPRQAGRLQRHRSQAHRAVSRRRRFRGRLGQAGSGPQLPGDPPAAGQDSQRAEGADRQDPVQRGNPDHHYRNRDRSEEHTSELQSQSNLVCRLLLEKKNE